MESALSVSALIVSTAAVIVSILSWRAAIRANNATIFEQRFAVYRDAEDFIRSWTQHGVPDIDTKLRSLVDAWNRSHLLFDGEVTVYLRKLWLDGLEANLAEHVIRGEHDGDYQAAVDKKYSLLRLHCADESPLRKVFVKHMKV